VFAAMLASGVGGVLSLWIRTTSSGHPGSPPLAAPLVGTLLVSAVLVVGGLAGAERRVAGERRAAAAVIGGTLGAALAELGGLLFSSRLSAPDARALGHGALHPLGAGMALGAAALFVVAARGIARDPQDGKADARLLLTGGLLLLTAATVQYLALPSLAPNLIAPRDALRVVAYALIVMAGLRQEAAIRRTASYHAALRERRQMACDLHDGLAQDLAFIAAHGAALDDEVGEGHPLELAARRALAVSRDAIHELSAAHERAA